MGQIVKRKKKGRPPKTDPASREPKEAARDLRRSLRRRNVKYVFDLDDYFDDDGLFEDDDEQREKKLKLLLKLQGGDEAEPQTSRRRVEHAPDTSSSDEDEENPPKKRKIEEVDDENDDVIIEDENYNEENEEEFRERKPESKGEDDSLPGSPLEAPYGVPLPDKKSLELILDKLQKKDIYGVYAEPVDPDESDVFLICSNAMKYNAPDTIYHKQARSIQELAKRKFDKIRLNVENSEKEIKPDQKMRSSSSSKKQIIKRSVSRMVQEPLGSDFSSGATLATPVDVHNVYNALPAAGYERPGSIEGLLEGNPFLTVNNLEKGEESLPGKGPQSRFSRKTFIHDDDRRATYTISQALPAANSESIFSTFEEESKQLVPVGLYSDHAYARSLARFAASLGSIAWKVASRRIEQALPEGFKFGRGWVGEYEPLPTPVLVMENCTVKEPAFFAKVEPAADPIPRMKIPVVLDSYRLSSDSESFLERKLPFLSPAVNKPPSAPIITASAPVKEYPMRKIVTEMKPSPFFSPGFNPHGIADRNFQHQISQSRTPVESDKKVLKQVELNDPPSFNKNAADLIGHSQVSKSSEIEASSPVEFTSRNAKFSPSGSFKQPDSYGIAGRGFNKNEADLIGHGQISKSSEIEASSPMEFASRNANLSPSGSFKQPNNYGISGGGSNKNAADPMGHRQISKSSEMEASSPMEFTSRNTKFSPSGSFKQPNYGIAGGGFYNNAADPTGRRQVSKSSEIEASGSMNFTSRNANFSPSGPFKHPDSHLIARGGLPDGNFVGNRLDSNLIANSSSDLAKAASYYQHEQGRGLSDPVQLMKMLSEKAQNQQNPSNQKPSDAPPSSGSVESNNAAAAAARVWMSVGAGGFRPAGENTNLPKNQIYNHSQYNLTRDSQPQVSRFRGEFPGSGMQGHPNKNSYPVHDFVPQGPIAMNNFHFQNQQMGFPQMVTADLSRFQMPPTWRNLSPQTHSRQRPESLPPDLNIGFQSSGSPGRPSSGVMVDSQHPDLALQL
ncbi:hypothetical protein ACJIZ3_013082 [Penstemon smallii]|uniref:Bromo domain-containing protein n=1 Tax=Penstemon smallii TaxID=265156 RepID=A0ABD3USC9_9LAMI